MGLLQRLLDRTFGAGLNPFYYLGAITFFLFWILLITGSYLFLFYDPSPGGAYPSVERMTVDQWWYGGLFRSIHRYASDALMLVIVLHVAQVLFSDRFRRHRWLAWFTGLLILPAVWFEGVTGYLLVWDQVAQVTARMVALLFDAAPINVEPLSRSLLRNDMVAPASLQILNYLHLALPCLLLLLAWVHCIRVSRPLVRPPWALGVPIIVLLVAGSLALPATSAPPMDLSVLVGEVPVDWFYLFPFPIMAASGLPPERLWLIFAVAYLIFVALPWLIRDPKPGRLSDAIPHGPVLVDRKECKGCDLCLAACPFEAVRVEKEQGGAVLRIAAIEPGRCAECGFCVTACEFSALSIDGWNKESFRQRIAELLRPRPGETEGAAALTFVCERSLNLGSFLDETGERLRDAPTVAAMPMPCIGAVGPGLVEYAFDAGAVAVTAVACPPLDCHYRAARSRLVGGDRPEEARYYLERTPHDRVKVFTALPDSGERLASMIVAFARKCEENDG